MLNACFTTIINLTHVLLLITLFNFLLQIFKGMTRNRTTGIGFCANPKVFASLAGNWFFNPIIAPFMLNILITAKDQPPTFWAIIATLTLIVDKFRFIE